jgi:hypothetical protein
VKAKTNQAGIDFSLVLLSKVPKARAGKHHDFISKVFDKLNKAGSTSALKISLQNLPANKRAICAALHRGAKKRGLWIATSSHQRFFYVWLRGRSRP